MIESDQNQTSFLDSSELEEMENIDQPANDLVVLSDNLPDHLIILPIEDRPIFPGIPVPLTFYGKKSLEAIKLAQKRNPPVIGVSMIRQKNKKNILESEFYKVGTAMRIFKVLPISEDAVQVIAQGVKRFRYIRLASNGSILRWEVKYHYEPNEKPDDELKAYAMAIISTVKDLLKLNPLFQEQLKMLISQVNLERPGMLMDLITSMLSADADKLQQVLETFDLYQRGKLVMSLLKEEKELLEIQQKIKSQVDEKISRQQKEFLLKEQLKAIKKELGIEKDGKAMEIEKIENRLDQLELSQEAAKIINSELDRLKIMEPNSPEFNVIRSYLDVMTELPWGIYSEDVSDIKKAREILDQDHYGLNDVKERILEFISTIIKRRKLTGSNILLVGPPGVGKTSVGKSIASALGREFYRFSVGGMRDEAEIKGHRRTYIGAMPGKLIESLRRTRTSNPVIMLDELDKLGKSYQGDPASALLEVLDPEQNKDFLDHYLDVRYDLSNVLFIATANQLDTIPSPLMDRMEIIRLSGYVMEEKVEIAKRYLIHKQKEAHGLSGQEVIIEDDVIPLIVDKYAREAGVRSLENRIKKIMRKTTLIQAEGNAKQVKVTNDNLSEFLGKPVFITEELYNKNVAGVALGLAYTALGGATLYIEANAVFNKKGVFHLTGQLGKVMQESARIAYSFIRSYAGDNEKVQTFFESNSVHLHVPAGATPKDGPSAGITMALALFSLATNKPIRNDVAMTGELTLTGKVLPIGGVREKTIAARRVGVKHIILPRENEKDFIELPDYIRQGLEVHYANYFEDVLKIAYI
ncbi:MAG: endopeptidase La [Candidatus Cyclobacteriaceae bacterium M3_2C_046]